MSGSQPDVDALRAVVRAKPRHLERELLHHQGRAFMARVAVDGVSALQERRDGRTADVHMGSVHLQQQRRVGMVSAAPAVGARAASARRGGFAPDLGPDAPAAA